MIEPEVVSLREPIEENLAHDWKHLIASTEGSFFQTPDWIGAWSATIGRNQNPIAAIWRVDGEVRAVVTLAAVSDRLHPKLPITVRLWTNAGAGPGSADHAGWVINASLADAVAAWLQSHIGKTPLLLRNVDSQSLPLGDSFSWQTLEETRCPRLTPQDYIDGTVGSNKLRKSIRNARRRLADAGVELHWYPPVALPRNILEDLFDLHIDRRDMVGGNSSFSGEDRFALHEHLVANAHPDSGPAAVVAAIDDRTVGVLYGFLFDRVFCYFQSGWDPDFSSMSMGSVLVDEAIRRSAESGCEVFDLLRGPEPYKYRFGASDVLDVSALSGSGIGSALIRAKYVVRRRRSERRDP